MTQLDDSVALALPRERARWTQDSPSVAAFAVDGLVIAVATPLAAWGRNEWNIFDSAQDLETNLAIAGLPIVTLWLLNLMASGAYSRHIFGAGSTEYKNVLRASAYAAGFVGIACYLTRFPLSRGFFFLLFVIGVPLLVVARFTVRTILHSMRRRGRLQQTVVIAGAPQQVDEIAGVLLRERWLGFSVLGALLPSPEDANETPRGLRVLGATSRTAEIVTSLGADFVLFAGGAVTSAQEMRRAVWELEEADVQMLLAPSLTDVASDRIRPRPAAGLPLVQLEGPSAHEASHLLKRVFDLALAGLLTILFAPIVLAIAVAIKLDDGGPVFFRQQRVGRNGTHFGLLKFRSMVVDAEGLMAELASQNRHGEDHVLFKAEHDPRITRVGRHLRRLSLDEVPQLLNVLRGDMSLVGPRPPLQLEVDKYDRDVHRRLAVRPGMTGLWQVSGRSDLSWEDSVRLDLYYVDNWSLTQDLIILGRTAQAVVSSRGAY